MPEKHQPDAIPPPRELPPSPLQPRHAPDREVPPTITPRQSVVAAEQERERAAYMAFVKSVRQEQETDFA